MSRSTVVIPADAAQVRVARLVATTAARRAGLDEEAVDDVRLAVGEALARAVLRCGERAAQVRMTLADDEGRFAVEVSDEGSEDTDDAGFAMAVINGLVPDVAVTESGGGGQTLRMIWSPSN